MCQFKSAVRTYAYDTTIVILLAVVPNVVGVAMAAQASDDSVLREFNR